MRPTRCEISKQAFVANYQAFQSLLPKDADILAVVKANAYGHGAVGMTRLLQSVGVTRFAVAVPSEALVLRRAGITDPIYLMGGPYGEYALCVQERLIPVFSDVDSLRDWGQFLNTSSSSVPCHLKLDTGMGRLGFLESEAVMALLREFPRIKVDGILTHLAVADEEDTESKQFTKVQLSRFAEMTAQLKPVCPELVYCHCGNSALSMRQEIPEGCRRLVRPGISLYGVSPQPWLLHECSQTLTPVLTWKTAIHSIKSFPSGAPLGYGRTFVTSRPSRIAVIPLGYADGYSRRLSNTADVLVAGKRAPVVGRVSMDLTIIDVTDIPDARRGDEVVLLGRQGSEVIPVEQLATWAGTIPYEIFCAISERVERVYVDAHC